MSQKTASRPLAKVKVRARKSVGAQTATGTVPAPNKRQLYIPATKGTEDREVAKTALSAQLASATIAIDFTRFAGGDLSLMETIAVLREKTEAVNGGNLKDAEALLVSQAYALNCIFADLARRAALNMGEYIDASARYLSMALKAQSQCRATLETLAVLKNPPVFAKQANIAHGPQQVNNGSARAIDSGSEQNKLLEAPHGERLDGGPAGTAISGDNALEAVGTIKRA